MSMGQRHRSPLLLVFLDSVRLADPESYSTALCLL